MINNILNIKFIEKFDLSVYKNSYVKKMLNDNNKVTLDFLDKLQKLYNNGWFEVPYVKNTLAWGEEIVFAPFSDKLFKVLHNNLNDTSLQIHPLKSERWLSLSDSTYVETDKCVQKLCYLDYINIPNNTIHSLKKDSLVFEEQDNNLFDNNETIRIYDKLGRKVNDEIDYYKYLLPLYRGKIKKLDNNLELNNITEKNYNKFIFIIEGNVKIKYKDKIYILDKEKRLFFINKDCQIISIDGLARIISSKFYKVCE